MNRQHNHMLFSAARQSSLPAVAIAFGLMLTFSRAFGQQDPLYAQYINNPFVLNPAYGGMTNNLNVSIGYRQQWAGFDGSPRTFNANGHISLLKNKMGAGLLVVEDKIGSTTVTEAYGAYSYRIAVGSDYKLSFGIMGGIANYKLDNSDLYIRIISDPLFATYSEIRPNVGAGVILTSDKLFVGLSVPRMLKANLTSGGPRTSLYSQHYYLIGSYLFFVSERIRFRPSTLLKLVSGAPASVDLNASFILYENYQAGIVVRNFNTYGLFMQALIRDVLRFGYVFEVPAGKSVGANFTTHELTLGIRINALRFHSNMSVFSF